MTDVQDNSAQIHKKLKRFFLEGEIANFYEYLNTLDEGLNIKEQEVLKRIEVADKDLNELDRNDERRKGSQFVWSG